MRTNAHPVLFPRIFTGPSHDGAPSRDNPATGESSAPPEHERDIFPFGPVERFKHRAGPTIPLDFPPAIHSQPPRLLPD